MNQDAQPPPMTGLVLAGAAALGAYQVGVISHVVEEVALALGATLTFDVLSGTSAGAINAAALATRADHVAAAVERLRDAWTSLALERTLRPSAVELLSMLTDLLGRPDGLERARRLCAVRGGLLDPRPIERMCADAVDGGRIAEHLRAGRLAGVALAATQVSSGRATVFYQGRATPRNHGGTRMEKVQLAPVHALASAAVPLLFPAVAIDGELYCDGGLRQLVPLSPALHLGARRLLVVSSVASVPGAASAGLADVASPLYLAGKALHALFTDGLDEDLDRLAQLNRVLDAGRRRFGSSFVDDLGAELALGGDAPLVPVSFVHIAPSRDVGALAAAYVAEPGFTRRVPGAAARALRTIADGDPTRAGDLFGYLLFDGGFAAELIELGRADARARRDELVALFAPHTRAPAP